MKHRPLLSAVVLLSLLSQLGCRDKPVAAPKPPLADAQVPTVHRAVWPERIRFGVTPVLDRDSMERGYGPLCQEIGRLLGTRVELFVAKSYSDLGEQVGRGSVEVGQFSPLAYVVAKQRYPHLKILGSQIAEGSTDYAAYIVTRADSDIQRPEDMAGRSFGFVDRASGSGYLYPLVYIWDRFGDPKRFFSQVYFLGNHQAMLREIAAGNVDAGATYSAALITYGQAGLGSPFRIVAKTGRIPFDAMASGPALNDAQNAALRSALLGINTRTARGRRVLGPLRHTNGFLPGNDAAYETIRQVVARAAMHGTDIGADAVGEDAGP